MFEIEPHFIYVCKSGNLDRAKQIYETHPNLDITYNDYEAFNKACVRGHVNICKWLLRINSDNMQGITSSYNNIDDIENYLIDAGKNGHLEMCKWLIDIYDYSDICIQKLFFECNHLHICKWLNKSGNI
jgi:hypothetical protein